MPGYGFLKFIKVKLEKLETALFYNYSRAVLRFPTTIIQLLKIDNDGNIWFKTRKPYNDISGLDKEFPGELHFYKKSFNYYIIVRGTATIVTTEPGFVNREAGVPIYGKRDEVLLSFKISAAEYFPVRDNINFHAVQMISDFVKSLLGEDTNYHLAFNN